MVIRARIEQETFPGQSSHNAEEGGRTGEKDPYDGWSKGLELKKIETFSASHRITLEERKWKGKGKDDLMARDGKGGS